jgi:NAD(P)-dependent dehydrogenase (short-subunit alcohol dehydrogenase family)
MPADKVKKFNETTYKQNGKLVTMQNSPALFSTGCAIVIGGSGGIGKGIATLLAQHTPVVVTYRNNADAAKALQLALAKDGRTVEVLQCDTTDIATIDVCFKAAHERFGDIHTVVNAAGSDIRMRFIGDLPIDEWTQVMAADANGFFHLLHHALPYLRKSRGSIVQISSIGLSRWPKKDVLSVAPKAAIEALMQGVAREEGRYGVRAKSVQLGVIDAGIFHRLKGKDFGAGWVAAATENTALKRFGTAHDVAEAVLFLASRQSAYTTGQSLRLDGGFAL